MGLKIAIIGAGSVGFTRQLVRDMLTVSELQKAEYAFMDISKQNLDMVLKLMQRDIDHNGTGTTLTGTTRRREALKNADFVLNLTRIGGLEAFAL